MDSFEAVNVFRLFAIVSKCTHAVAVADVKLSTARRLPLSMFKSLCADGNAHWQAGRQAAEQFCRDSSRAGSGSGADPRAAGTLMHRWWS